MKLERILAVLRWLDEYAPDDWDYQMTVDGAPSYEDISAAIQVAVWAVLGMRHLTDHDIERFEGAAREDLAQALYALADRSKP